MTAVHLTPLAWQPTLLGGTEPAGFDASFARARRRWLGAGAWIDVVPGWVSGADALFSEVVERAPWAAHQRPMYDRIVAEPRLTTRRWTTAPAAVIDMAAALGDRYALHLAVVSANLYRDGNDSVAWHGDRIGRNRGETVVALISLGTTRRFLLRPKGGGASIRIAPAAGDLLVMGGTCQRTWEHSVPKCAPCGPRVSVMFREGY